MVSKTPKPEPVVTATECSLCAEPWEDHGENPTVLKCVELLRAKRMPNPVYRKPVFREPSLYGHYCPSCGTWVSNPGFAHNCFYSSPNTIRTVTGISSDGSTSGYLQTSGNVFGTTTNYVLGPSVGFIRGGESLSFTVTKPDQNLGLDPGPYDDPIADDDEMGDD